MKEAYFFVDVEWKLNARDMRGVEAKVDSSGRVFVYQAQGGVWVELFLRVNDQDRPFYIDEYIILKNLQEHMGDIHPDTLYTLSFLKTFYDGYEKAIQESHPLDVF